jgi:excinuclease UvrABC ATPase subunit
MGGLTDLESKSGNHFVATGTPEEMAKVKKSYSGMYLKKMLGK